MCGIVGAESSNSKQVVEQMLERLKYRGPDHVALTTIEQLTIGHARLSILDISSSSNQPLWDVTKRACIVFNGEIYNYKALRSELKAVGYSFSSQGDAEVIINMYLEYGVAAFERLRGIFALAIWDMDKRELILARDAFGVKPLYYTESSNGFYFASEIKALLVAHDLSLELNYDALLRSVVFLWSPGPETVLSGIHKLEPGHYLKVKDKKISEKVMYSQWPSYLPGSGRAQEHFDELESCLRESVRAQLVADVAVGAFLSGGLDSSLIVAMASEIYGNKLECFTIDSTEGNSKNDGFADDLPYAKAAASHVNVPLNIVEAKPDIIKYLSWMIYHLDEPQADPAPINVAMIARAARKKGIKVLFSGAGGDDVFSGYRRHYAIKLERFWSWLPSGGRAILKSSTRKLPKSNPVFRRISKMFAYADLNSDDRLLSYFYWISPDIAYSLFTDEAKQKMSENPFSSLISEIEQLSTKDPLEKMLYLERKYFLVDHNFNYTDKMSMAYGVEVRVPFLDRRVVEYASKIPSKLKQRGKQGKWILKKVAERYLPKSIIYRPKTGFGAPLRSWLQNDLKEVVDELLGKESLEKRGIFKFDAVQSLIDADREGAEDYAYPIFSLVCIEVWCRIFIDGDESYTQFMPKQKEQIEEFA